MRGSNPLVDSFLGSRDMHVDVATRRPWKGRAPIRSSRHSERNYRTLYTMHGFDATEFALSEPIPVYVISMAKKSYPERTT
jgi:hypothetical protein